MRLIRGKIAVVPRRDIETALASLRPGSIGVLNVAREEEFGPWFWTSRDRPMDIIEYAKVPLHNDDNHAVEVMAAVHVLRGLSERHPRVIVTCHEAANRSPAVVAVWLAQQFGIAWRDAVAEVKQMRPHLDTHRGLLRTIAQILPNGPTNADILAANL